jgi:hypothetical protein
VAYRADIEIGVKGQDAIGRLQKQLDGTLHKINELNKTSVFRTGNVAQNIDRYTKQLNLAAQALDLVALGTTQETRAINNYVTAVGRANAARERQTNLIDAEIKKRQELERIQKLTAAGIFETTRFKEPIGPALPPTVGSTKGFPSSPIGGGLNMPGSPAARAAQRKTFENVALGAGFPLLFGGGPGAVLGGAAGGLIPGSPMMSVVTSALGTQLDNIIKSATDFSKSLRDGGDAATYLEQKLGYLDPTVKKQIQNLQNSGQTAEAAKVAFNKLASEIGQDGAAAFLQAGKNAEGLQSSFTKLTLSIVAAGFAFNKYIEDQKAFKFDLSKLPAAIRPAQVAEGEGTTSAYKQKTAELQNQNVLLGQQAQLKGIDSKLDVDGYAFARRKVAQQEYTNELLKIANQLKSREIGLDQNQLLIRAANLQLAGKLKDIELDRTRQVAQNNEEAARAAKQAADEQDRVVRAVANTRKETLSTVLEGVNAQYELDTLYKGQQVVLQQRIKNAQNELDLKTLIVNKEEEAALASAKTPQEQTVIVKLYDQKLKLLQIQANIQQKINTDKAVELKYAKDLLAVQRQGVLTQTASAATLDITQARGTLSKAKGGTGFEEAQAALNIEQNMQLDELAQKLTEINLLKDAAAKATGDEATKLQGQVAQEINLYNIQNERLNTLFALQQEQLKLNQVTEQYGGIANAIGTAFATSFRSIIDGSMTAKEALVSFFQSVADAFLDMAAQIIAKWITMTILNTILRLFPGGGGGGLASKGGSGFDMGAINNTGMGTFNPGNSFKFAEGGFVTGPTNALIGEGGQPEYVIPASKMRESMGRYAAGARGSAVIGSGNGTSDSGGGTATMTGSSIDVRYTVERINSVDYVTADQFQQGMQKAAMEGAQRGQQATLRRLQNSSSTRRSVGI